MPAKSLQWRKIALKSSNDKTSSQSRSWILTASWASSRLISRPSFCRENSTFWLLIVPVESVSKMLNTASRRYSVKCFWASIVAPINSDRLTVLFLLKSTCPTRRLASDSVTMGSTVLNFCDLTRPFRSVSKIWNWASKSPVSSSLIDFTSKPRAASLSIDWPLKC